MTLERVSGRSLKTSQNLAWVENALGVKGRLDPPHQGDLDRAANQRQEIALQLADAVFGRDGPAELGDNAVHHSIDLAPALEERVAVHPWRLAHIEVDIAVAEMAEGKGPRPRHEG